MFVLIGNYAIYDNGKVFSLYRKDYLKGEITKHGYLQYSLFLDGKKIRIKAHRLVALLFLQKPDSPDKVIVHHKDGDKLNNDYTNLEWTTYEYNNRHARETRLNEISKSNSERWNNESFRKQTSKNISEGLKRSGAQKGANNPRFKYKVYDKYGKVYSRNEVSEIIGLSLSRTDVLIRETANGKVNPYFIKNNLIVKNVKCC